MQIHRNSLVSLGLSGFLVPFLASVAGSALAQEPAEVAAGELRLRTERAVVFKDGHALLVKEGRGTVAADGTLFTHEVPDAAVLGSFWASCEAAPIRSLRAEWIERTEERSLEVPCESVRDLLAANAGRDVTLTTQWPEERQVSCKIVGVLEREPAAAAVAAEHASGVGLRAFAAADANEVPPAGVTTTALTPLGGALVAIELPGDGSRAEPVQRIVPVADVRSIAGSGLRTTCVRKERVATRRKRLTFVLGPEAAGREVAVRILYFTPGLRWIPTYRLVGDLAASGELELQAEILNELEDLDGAAVDLVVGVPNFRFGELISPLSLERSMRNVLQQAAPQLMGQGNAFSNAMFTQRAGERQAPVETIAGAVDLSSELEATGEQDLFVYTVPGLTLRRAARATVPLWTSKLGLRHLYTFDVNAVREPSRGQTLRTSAGNGSPLELAKNEVWHQVQMRNGSAVPWTTGAALVLRGTLPLGQDLLTYTPVGGSALLPITVAVDVRGDYEERQLSIDPNALEWDGRTFARITKRGTVVLTNREKEAIEMRVRVGTGGKVLRAEGDPQIALRSFDPRDWQGSGYETRLNGHSDLTWNLSLDPGASRVVSFDVEMYVQ